MTEKKHARDYAGGRKASHQSQVNKGRAPLKQLMKPQRPKRRFSSKDENRTLVRWTRKQALRRVDAVLWGAHGDHGQGWIGHPL